MLAEFFMKVFERLDSRHKPEFVSSIDPKTGAVVVGYFLPDGKFTTQWTGHGTPEFPAVVAHNTESLCRYIDRYGAVAMGKKSALLYVNQGGLFGVLDYGPEGTAARRIHRVAFPSAFDESCAKAAQALGSTLGKWTDIDDFSTMLDTCAPFIANFEALQSATANIEGNESVKINKTGSRTQVIVTGEASTTVDLPKVASIRLMFMGQPIAAELPLRIQVKDKQIQFYLVDNGSITTAKDKILKGIRSQVAEAFPELMVIDGEIR